MGPASSLYRSMVRGVTGRGFAFLFQAFRTKQSDSVPFPSQNHASSTLIFACLLCRAVILISRPSDSPSWVVQASSFKERLHRCCKSRIPGTAHAVRLGMTKVEGIYQKTSQRERSSDRCSTRVTVGKWSPLSSRRYDPVLLRTRKELCQRRPPTHVAECSYDRCIVPHSKSV